MEQLDNEEFRAYIEQLRAKYRQEALEAVRQAETRGYERGCEKMKEKQQALIQQQLQQIDSLQNANQLLQNSLRAHTNGTYNIKDIMELVFKGVRSEWKDDPAGGAVIARMKSVLIHASEALLNAFGQENCLIVNAPRQVQHRPRVLQVSVPVVFPKYYIRISINNTDELHVQRMLGKPVVTTYTIDSSFYPWTPEGETGNRVQHFRQDRRFKEFLVLQQSLRKECPGSVVPVIPDADNPSATGSDTSLVQRRMRGLALWLQCICLHENLQTSQSLLDFLAASTNRQSQQRRRSFLGQRLLNLETSGLSSTSRRALLRELAHRNILTVKRDVTQLLPQATQAVEASHRLVSAYLAQEMVLQSSVSVVQGVTGVERNCPSEHSSWNCMAGLSSRVAPAQRRIGMLYQSGIYEPLAFFGMGCMRAASTAVDEAAARFANSSLSEEQRVAAAEGAGFEWATTRRTKTCLLLQQFAFTASQLSHAFKDLTKSWQELADQLEAVIPGSSGDISPRNKGKQAASRASDNPRNLAGSKISGHEDASTINNPQLDKPIVPVGTRRIVRKEFAEDSNAAVHGSHASRVDHNFGTPNNRTAHARVNTVQEDEKESDKDVTGRYAHSTPVPQNDVFKKQRHAHTPIQPSQSVASRRHKTKIGTNTDVTASDDVFVVTSQHVHEDLSAAVAQSLPVSQSGAHAQTANSVQRGQQPVADEPQRVNRQRTQSENIVAESVDLPRSKASMNLNQATVESAPSAPSSFASSGNLPDGWERVETEDGRVYFYHRVTRVSRWDCPDEHVAAALESRLNESSARVNDAVERRRLERVEQLRLQQSREQESSQLQALVKARLLEWAEAAGRRRPLFALLNSVSALLPSLDIALGNVLSALSAPSEVKKAYLKVVRVIHPDKLSGDLELESKLLAEAAFVVLSEVYGDYKKAHHI